ncbi:hypothetical protein FRC07_001106 [Ceratobasidium sp. 392]|nr:hypothetical protein FRC07_001106 [Ceratobasidium sp. 392]
MAAVATLSYRQSLNATYNDVYQTIVGPARDSRPLNEALEAFKAFLTSEENVTISNIFLTVSETLESKTDWQVILRDVDGPTSVEALVKNALDGLQEEYRKISKEYESELPMIRREFQIARLEDQKKIAQLTAVIEQQSKATENLATAVRELVDHNLKIIGDPTISQPHQDAKDALAIITELTGQTLPPSTILDENFVTIEKQTISQGTSYDVFLGEYFKREKVAVKVLRQRVPEATAKKMHERYARQVFNWSSLRHDAILPFYGAGVTRSLVSGEEFQLFLVSPYLQNRDAALDIARGLDYLHEFVDLPPPARGIVHSTLNIFNVLIKDSGRAVISGFGHSKAIEGVDQSFTGNNSEYRYMGPELLQDDPHVTFGTDIYAWAMTTLEILTDVPPFGEKAKGPRIITMIASGQRPKRIDHPKLEHYPCSDDLWSLIEECWKPAPLERPSAGDLVVRLKPLLQQFGRASKPAVRVPTPPPPLAQGPAQAQLGKSNQPAVQSPPAKG